MIKVVGVVVTIIDQGGWCGGYYYQSRWLARWLQILIMVVGAVVTKKLISFLFFTLKNVSITMKRRKEYNFP